MSTDIAVAKGGSISRPDYLAKYSDQPARGIDNLKQYFVPPIVKVLQGQSDQSLRAMYGEGSIVITPLNTLVSETDLRKGSFGSFTFVPIVNFTEWASINPHGVKELNFMRERTNDPKSDLAKRARNFKVKGARTEDCPEAPGKQIRYCEFINFLCIIDSVEELKNSPVLLSFWSTGHSDGRMLANLILSRQAHIYSMRFQATVGPRNNDQGNWWGLNMSNPLNGTPAFVETEEDFLRYQAMHEHFDKMRRDSEVQIEYDTEEVAPTVDVNNSEF